MNKTVIYFVLLLFFSLSATAEEIHVLAANGELTKIQALLQKQPELVNRLDQDKWTPLHFAALGGHLKVAAFLVDRGAEVNIVDKYGLAPLDLAALKESDPLVDLLIRRGAEIRSREEILDRLGQRTEIPVLNFKKELVELLASKGITPEAGSRSFSAITLVMAIMKVREDVAGIKDLKELDQRPTFHPGTTSLHQAAEKGDLPRVKYLVQSNPRAVNVGDEFGITPLHFAAINNQREVVEYLIAQGALINTRTHKGITPLYGACSEGRKEIAALLIARGAVVNAATVEGATPLHAAPTREVAELLIKHGAKVMALNKYGYTPLHIAALYGHIAVARYLISRGAGVNQKNVFGWTPLMEAVYGNHGDAVLLLLEKGAYVNAKNQSGSTALEIATILKSREIAAILRKHDAFR
jgi:ankyrin repeat protein